MKNTFCFTLFMFIAVLLPGQSPRLVIPFGHVQGISSAAFSPNGQLVLTGGLDGTAKLWDLKGRLLQTYEAKETVLAVAFSPDGKMVLTGSADHTAKLWDITGRERQSFIGHDYWVEAVAFSPDGTTILTGSTDGTAKLWDMDGNPLQSIDIQSNGKDAIRVVAFSPDGQTVLIGSGELEGRFGAATLWNLPENDLKTFTGRDGEINAVAFSPDGQTVLTAGKNGVKLWDLAGKVRKAFTDQGKSTLYAAFSPDGKTILTGHRDGAAKLWRIETGELLQTIRGHKDWITVVAFSPASPDDPQGGNYILTGSQDGAAKLWSRTGHEIQSFTGHTHKITNAAFSSDGLSILTHSEGARRPLSWPLTEREVRPFEGAIKPERLIKFLTSSPDGKTKLASSFLSNTATLKDLADNVIQTFAGHNGHVEVVDFSPDGKMVLTGSWDGTAKIWDLAGQELATLVVLDSTDWVVTAPNGLFDASPRAMNLMHFVVGTQAIDLEQLKERYFEPGLLSKLLGFNQDPLRSAEAFNAVPLYPGMTAQTTEDKLKLQVMLTPRSGGIGKLSLFVNGKEVEDDANPQRTQALSIDLTAYAEYYLPGEINKLVLRVYNEAGWLKSSALEIDYQPPATARGGSAGTSAPTAPATASLSRPKPALYAIVVGTADYSGDQMDLKFSDRDASFFSQALRAAAPKVFSDKVFVTLLNTDPTDKTRQEVSSKANIQKAFADVATKAKAQDVLLIYLSGHGVNYGTAESGQFYYLTKDIASENLIDPEIRKNYAISSSELTEWIKGIHALKQVMIIDACNSGKIVEDLAVRKDLSSSQVRAIDRMKDRTGMFILTGSSADKVSYEASQYGQGLLTYSLLQGMSGLALSEDKRVDMMSLFQYSRDKVPELAKGIGGIQTPVLAFPVSGASFDIGIVDTSVNIPLAQVKPVFIRNNFTDEEAFDDGLGLAQALANHFRRLTVKGAQAELIYVDVSEYENGYSIKGLYTIKGDEVAVRGRLFKGKTAAGAKFTVAGKKDDIPALVEAIVEKVMGMVR